jgi:hypothetical protein
MKISKFIIFSVIVLTTLPGCYKKEFTIGAFNIVNIELIAGSTSNPDLVECSTLTGTGLVTGVLNGNYYPSQPKGGDWYDVNSTYFRNLLKTGKHAYHCAIARVTIQRNPNVAPNDIWDVGDTVHLKVVAPHFCGNAHPGEDNMQPLSYKINATQDGQTQFVFNSVIVASECGVGPYSEDLGERFTVHFGQAPPIVGEPLEAKYTTNQLDCLLMVGQQLNFGSCQQP